MLQASQQGVTAQKNLWDQLGVIADQPKYPEYASLDRRLRSFKGWPKNKSQTPTELAEAGFAYTGVDDAVRCYHCGNGLRDWEPKDRPWTQHAYHFRTCAHVRLCKGDGYIRRIHGETEVEIDGDGGNDGDLKQMLERNNVAISAAKEFDAEDKQIEGALKYFVKRQIHIFSAVDLIKAIEEIELNGVPNTTVCQSNTSTDSKPYSNDKEENDSLKDPITCKICYSARARIITIPCGHMATCPQCIGPLKTCCICRSAIEGTVRACMSDES